MKKVVLAALALCVMAVSVPAAEFGPAQYAITDDDGTPITNFDLAPALLSQLALLPGAYAVGNPKGDVTLRQFYDLNCPYCREAAADIDQLLHSDKNLKLVFMPYAMLSVQSVQGALVEAAVAKMVTPERFVEFHRRLYAERGVIDGSRAVAVAQGMGLDTKKIIAVGETPATLAILKQNSDFGAAAKLVATPDYVINGVAILGHPGLKPLQKVIAAVRACGKVVCG